MPDPQQPEFTIVGAGLAGALMACYLGRAGRRVDVYERRPDPRSHGQERGRSINLALSVRGIEALRAVRLAEDVLKTAIPMRGRMIHSPTGQLTFQPYGKDESQAINSVSRGGLNRALVEAAAACPSVRLFFDRRCTDLDPQTGDLELLDTATNRTARVEAQAVIAADGAYSAVRGRLQRLERFDYQQTYESHGYKELTIPPADGGGFRMERHALHIWPRHSFMMIALPNLDGSFTCTLFWPYDGPNSFASVRTEADLGGFFDRHFPDAVPLMPALTDDYFANPVGPLVTIHCHPWHVGGRVALLGDAAHAVIPFLGQGMNAAFEDCAILDACLADHPADRATAFAAYEDRRRENTDALAEMCVANFLEMRDRVSSRWFVWRKRLAILLHQLLPHWYIPLYTLITFTTTPYAAARRRARQQDQAVRLVLAVLAALALAALLYLVWP
ncbi:MAG: FAD-dependent monooxygenase [Gemmataceae bacterium]|nr:FAD-dependent monooxygenase [Gemmataceae bacterium]